MTGPIKPPGGARPPAVHDRVDAQTPRNPAPAEGERTFGDAARAADASPPIASSGPASTVAPTTAPTSAAGVNDAGLDDIAEGMATGALDRSAAIDALVERALAAPEARALNAAGRDALAAHLRAQLEDDPNLSQLLDRAAEGG